MKIIKILNNNAVVVRDGIEEKVAIGKGIAFQKRKNDLINPNNIEKLFVKEEKEKIQQLLSRIPAVHFIISEEIITYAEKLLNTKLSEHVYIILTDHLSFAIEREMDGIKIRNKLLNEIKILYRQEFEIGLWAVQHIKEKLKVELSEDEAAFIALHIHTMKPQSNDLLQTIKQTTIIKYMVEIIKNELSIVIKEDDLSYHRLVTHLRYALTRAHQYDIRTLDDEIIDMIKKKFANSYHCALKVAKELLSTHGIHLPEQELAYITLHIERLRN